MYERLSRKFGPQHWWPGQTRFEVIIGAILTQNTNWGNVERAIAQLKKNRVLTPLGMKAVSQRRLATLIKPSGYFNVKAKRLKNFIQFLFKDYDGDLNKMAKQPWTVLRQELLNVNGIGPETADSILLYAFDKPVFVVDAYTKRIFSRLGLTKKDVEYSVLQELFARNLKADVSMFNEYHALLVRLGKEHCRPRPRCLGCPLDQICFKIL